MRTWTMGLAIALSACEGDKDPTQTSSDFTAIRDDVLVPSCGTPGCHDSDAGGLTIDDLTVRGDLVGVVSALNPANILVIAGDAENSYLVRKMEGRIPINGEPMPPPSGAEPDDIEAVRTWIDAGAL